TGVQTCALPISPNRGPDRRRRGLLDELLVSPLNAALPFDEADPGPAIPEEHLHLHVTGLLQILLEEQVGVAEVRACDGLRSLERFCQAFGSVHAGHADPPAARGRL